MVKLLELRIRIYDDWSGVMLFLALGTMGIFLLVEMLVWEAMMVRAQRLDAAAKRDALC